MLPPCRRRKPRRQRHVLARIGCGRLIVRVGVWGREHFPRRRPPPAHTYVTPSPPCCCPCCSSSFTASPLISGLERWAISARTDTSSVTFVGLGRAEPAPQWIWALASPAAMRPTPGTGGSASDVVCDVFCGDLPPCACHLPGAAMTSEGEAWVANASALSPGARYATQITATDPSTGASSAAELIVMVEQEATAYSHRAVSAAVAFSSGVRPASELVIRAVPGGFVTLSETVSGSIISPSDDGLLAFPHLAAWPPIAGLGSASNCPAAAATHPGGAARPLLAAAVARPGSCSLVLTWAVDALYAGRAVPLCIYAVAIALNGSGVEASGGAFQRWPASPLALYAVGALTGNDTGADVRCYTLLVDDLPPPSRLQGGRAGLLVAGSVGSSVVDTAPPLVSFGDWAQGQLYGPATAAAVGSLAPPAPAIVVTSGVTRSATTPGGIAFPRQPAAIITINNATAGDARPLMGNVRPSFWAALPVDATGGFDAATTVQASTPGVVEWLAVLLTSSHGPHRVPDVLAIATTVSSLARFAANGTYPSGFPPSLRALSAATAFTGAFAMYQPFGAKLIITVVACNVSVTRFTPACVHSTEVAASTAIDDGSSHTFGLRMGDSAGPLRAFFDEDGDAASVASPWVPLRSAYMGVVASLSPTCSGGRCAGASASDALAAAYLGALLTGATPRLDNSTTRDISVWAGNGVAVAFSGVPAAEAIICVNVSFSVQACSSEMSFVEWIDSSAVVINAAPGADPAAIFRFHCRDDSGAAVNLRGSASLIETVKRSLTVDPRSGWRVSVLGPASEDAIDSDAQSIVEGGVFCTSNCAWARGDCVPLRLRFGSASYPSVWEQPAAWASDVTTNASFALALSPFAAALTRPSLLDSTFAVTSCDRGCPTVYSRTGDQLILLSIPQLSSQAPFREFFFDALVIATLLSGEPPAVSGSPLPPGALPTVAAFMFFRVLDGALVFAAPAVRLSWTLSTTASSTPLSLAVGVNGLPAHAAHVFVDSSPPSPVHAYVTICNGSSYALLSGESRACSIVEPIVPVPLFDGGCTGNSPLGACLGVGQVVAGTHLHAFIVLRDSSGNLINATADDIAAANVSALLCLAASCGAPAPCALFPASINDGALLVLVATIELLSAGTFNLFVFFGATSIQLSPLTVAVVGGRPSALGSRAVVDDCAPLTHVWSGVRGELAVFVGDSLGVSVALAGSPLRTNSTYVEWDALRAVLAPRSGSCNGEAAVNVSAIGATHPGWYSLTYEASCAGWYSVRASVASEAVPVVLAALSCPGPHALVPARSSGADHVFVSALSIDPARTTVVYADSAVIQAGAALCAAGFVPRDGLGNARALPPNSGDQFFADVTLTVPRPALPAFDDGLAGSWQVSAA